MEKYNKIIDALKQGHEDGNLYLVDALSYNSGFFVKNTSVVYAVENNKKKESSKIDRTKFLTLMTNTKIFPQETKSIFNEGYYDLIEFKDDDEDLLKIFIELCTIHSEKNADMPIFDFFNALTELLSNRSEQMYKNALGCFGELAFIKHVKNSTGESIGKYWHLDGPYSKTDFNIGKYKIEVKTVQNVDPIIRIKEKQIRRNENLYLIVVCVSNTQDGISLDEQFSSIEKLGEDFNTFDFSLKLAQEKSRIDKNDLQVLRFEVEGIYIYPISELKIISQLPFEVSNLSYDYAFDINTAISCDDLVKILSQEIVQGKRNE